jgi:DNA modification methylase
MSKNSVLVGDALTLLKTLDSESVHCCVTSPPYYGLRDYGIDQQIGLEETPELYIAKLVEVFREARRVR